MTKLDPLRVLIVDDSRIFRGVIQTALESLPSIEVIGSVFNGEKAMIFITEHWPDLVSLDIEMPGMNGIEVLKGIRALCLQHPHRPPIEVLLVSSLTHQGARSTIEGLQLGAVDFILKPAHGNECENAIELTQRLKEKIDVIRSRRSTSWPPKSSPSDLKIPTSSHRPAQHFRALAIGVSTGGPEALSRCLPKIADAFPGPILIVQHILPGFSTYLAESLSRRCPRHVMEASDGAELKRGCIFLAPSLAHLVVRGSSTAPFIGLSDAPAENGCRPAADVLFRSAASVFKNELIAIVMTGMGSDGAKGALSIHRAGGYVIAQDEASSTVWGMPRAAIEAGAANAIVSLDQVANHLRKTLGETP